VIVLIIDEPSPSLNVTMRGHWSKQHKLRNRWFWLVKAAIRRAQIWIPPKWPKAKIRIERYGPRILDADNFRGGTKFLTDALKQEGIITDDTPAVIGEPELRQIVGKESGTKVFVEAA
jgi:hypothetical protein